MLPAVPSSEVYLEDCITALKRFNDNHFDLAIVDPSYAFRKSMEMYKGIKCSPFKQIKDEVVI